jgi:predicted homoserine dehydrogenase-like protein
MTNNAASTVAQLPVRPGAPADVVRVGVIGYGYWGPNIVRNVTALDGCELVAVCDRSQEP